MADEVDEDELELCVFDEETVVEQKDDDAKNNACNGVSNDNDSLANNPECVETKSGEGNVDGCDDEQDGNRVDDDHDDDDLSESDDDETDDDNNTNENHKSNDSHAAIEKEANSNGNSNRETYQKYFLSFILKVRKVVKLVNKSSHILSFFKNKCKILQIKKKKITIGFFHKMEHNVLNDR